MPDIQLRFQKDMLVLSAPVDATLERQGIDVARDREYLNLMEPDTVRDALQLEVAAGAQCIVTATEDITRARLAHVRMSDDADRLANAALALVGEVKPQHVLAEIGPCGLPLDESSKSSLNENRQQYADAARVFENASGDFDAFFLNGFASVADLKCALMGIAKVSGKPVFASVNVAARGVVPEAPMKSGREPSDVLPDFPFDSYSAIESLSSPPEPAAKRACLNAEGWAEAVDAMADLGAAVIGFETPDPADQAIEYAKLALARAELPVLAQLQVSGAPASKFVPVEDASEYTPDTLPTAAMKLQSVGVQFLRATGAATAACTGALAAAVAGLDVRER